MIDWDQILDDLIAMYDYFTKCAVSAAPGSEARKRFTRYTETLYTVAVEIKEYIGEEDDGK